MNPAPVLVALAVLMTIVLIAIEVSLRDGWPHARDDLDPGRGPPDGERTRSSSRSGSPVTVTRDGPGDEAIYTIFESSELLAVDHLRGMDAVDDLLRQIADEVRDAKRSPRRRPRRPTSILFHGPPGGAMAITSHALARGFRARLVQLFAGSALPSTDGGAQPTIAAAVSRARDHLPSVLVLDELEYVASASVHDADRLRTASDLLAEALRPIYGTAHVVVGVYTLYDDHPVPRRLTDAFEHIIAVDLPQLERALRVYALRTGDHELFRAVSGPRLAEHPDLAPPSPPSAA